MSKKHFHRSLKFLLRFRHYADKIDGREGKTVSLNGIEALTGFSISLARFEFIAYGHITVRARVSDDMYLLQYAPSRSLLSATK